MRSKTRLQAAQYYIHRSYANTYYRMYLALEDYLSKTIFRKDTSRVFLASNEYVFRRRFELLDPSLVYENVEASSLQFPFANYWPQNVGWIADDRLAANTAALVYLGVYEGSTKVKAAASYLPIPVQLYFDREDDARLAYEILYFKSFNEHYYSTAVSYGNETLAIPANIKITNLVFNPQFKETDWLKQNRIFVISVTFNMRSYAILPPDQPDYNIEMDEEGILSDGNEYNDGVAAYSLVNDVVLNFGKQDHLFETYECSSYEELDAFPEEGIENIIYVNSHYDLNETTTLPSIKNRRLRTYIWNPYTHTYEPYTPWKLDANSIAVNGSVEESEFSLVKFNILPRKRSATISWETSNTEDVNISKIELWFNGAAEPIDIEPSTTRYSLKDLTSSSTYVGMLIFYLSNGESKKYQISFRTKDGSIKETEKALIASER